MIVHGSEGVKLIECINPDKNKWRVRWDVRPDLEAGEGAMLEGVMPDGVIYEEAEFDHQPTEAELRKLFTKYYNDITDNKILSGFVWNGMRVWLSEENQRNYKAAYDLAVQKNGFTLPVTFKFGTEEHPVYQVFTTLEELENFYLPAVQYVQQCLSEGWQLKDSIDYSLYTIN